MRRVGWLLGVLAAALVSGCGGSSSVNTSPALITPSPGASGASFILSPPSLDLTSALQLPFYVQGAIDGESYTASADPSCATTGGGVFVAGDGIAQPALPDTAIQFTAYGIGATAVTCTIGVVASDGSTLSIPVTFGGDPSLQTTTTTSLLRPLAATAGTVSPTATTVNRGDRIPVSYSGFTAPVKWQDLGCETTGSTGISLTPKNSTSGSGTFYIVAYGQGAMNRTCLVHVIDSAGANVPITLTISLNLQHRLTASPHNVSFACGAASGPAQCASLQTVTVHETGSGNTFAIAGRPNNATSCRYAFTPQLNLNLSGSTSTVASAAGPSAMVAFSGYLYSGTSLPCAHLEITDNNTPPQSVTLAINSAFTVTANPVTPVPVGCTGSDPNVRVSGKPHGMYVWNVNHFSNTVQNEMAALAGKDPSLCGVSLVINWDDVNPTRGVYNWSAAETPAMPYVTAGLRVNLLFADGAETGTDQVVPTWVTNPTSSGGDGVPVIACSAVPGEPAVPPQPYYPNATFEADWAAFMKAAVQHFTGPSPISANIGYMRFGQGFGTEDEPGHGYDGTVDNGPGASWSAAQPACTNAWYSTALTPALSPATWQQHSQNIINAIAAAGAGTNVQYMIAVNGFQNDAMQSIGGFPGLVGVNASAMTAAAAGIGFGTENLGDTSPSTAPCAAGGSSDLYWCAAVNAPFAASVPIEFQPITATTTGSHLDISTLLPYALGNHAQILELYPSEFLTANGLPASDGDAAPSAATQAKYACALYSASLVLGAPTITPAPTPPC